MSGRPPSIQLATKGGDSTAICRCIAFSIFRQECDSKGDVRKKSRRVRAG
jgi:hypothetical protein